ncbi:MAG TPA: hypothetical protein VGI50_14790 [Solirubrobacteraceae bacterium]
MTTRLLLDTSAVFADASALALTPDQTAAISVITLGELNAGVRLAADARSRALRQARLSAVRSAFDPIPVDETVVTTPKSSRAPAPTTRRPRQPTC